MATETLPNPSLCDKWQDAKARLDAAEAVYEEYKAAADPLYGLQAAFEARHGLVAPGGGRIGTPDYFEKRKALFEENPQYRVPEEVSDNLEKMVDIICDMQSELMKTPAPDLVALRWKLDHTMGYAWEDFYIDQMKVDIETLMVSA